MHATESHDWNDRAEIDLVDILLVVKTYRWWFVGVFLVVFALAAVYASIKPLSYEYQTTVEIGGYWSGRNSGFSGTFKHFENASAVVVKLRDSYLPQTLRTAVQEGWAENIPSKISVRSEKDSDTVSISTQVPESQDEIARRILDEVAAKLVAEHANLLDERKRLRAGFLQERIEELNARIGSMRASREHVAAGASADGKAMTMLMADSILQNLEHERAKLMDELTVNLPSDLKPTQILSPPERSIKPVSPGLAAILGIGMFGGLMLGFLAVFAAHMVNVARKREIAKGQEQ